MTTTKRLTYRGQLTRLLAAPAHLVLATTHAEKFPSAVYWLEFNRWELDGHVELPAGAVDLVADAADPDAVWALGADGALYRCQRTGTLGKPVALPTEQRPLGMVALGERGLAVLAGDDLLVLELPRGKLSQRWKLSHPGTALAAEAGGKWIVTGTSQGEVAVYQAEDQDEFVLSDARQLHQGAVTSLLFEPDDLRFYSAGVDQRLLSTHARGELDPEDRGRGGMHDEQVTAICNAPGDRFITGSRDQTCKTWARGGATRPATLSDGMGAVVDLALLEIHQRWHLVAACADQSLRIFLVDAGGRFGQQTYRLEDAYALAEHRLGQPEIAQREEALRALAGYDDAAAIDQLARHLQREQDPRLRQLATQLLAGAQHPRAAKCLEPLLKHADEAVRREAFAGLRTHAGPAALEPLELALAAGKADIGCAAVAALEELAPGDVRAFYRLEDALNREPYEVRRAALFSLQALHDPESVDAEFLALGKQRADIRRLALIRLLERERLQLPRVQAAVRRLGEDPDPDVRQVAFLVSVATRPQLAEALAARAPDIARQLAELRSDPGDAAASASGDAAGAEPERKASKKTPAKKKASAKRSARGSSDGTRGPVPRLAAADLQPLLHAAASQALDTALHAAQALAVLEDPRALGLLLQLSRDQDAAGRASVCRALSRLHDPQALGRLRSLTNDAQPEVRDAAYTALEKLHGDDPVEAAQIALDSAFADVRQRGLETLVRSLRKKLPADVKRRAEEIMRRALNDPQDSLRSEAFKACLNLELGGGGGETLRLVLQSVHADLRSEVHTELMAQAEQPWAWELLCEAFSDPDPTLRQEAFEFAVKRTKGRDLACLQAAAESRYADLRLRAVGELRRQASEPAEAVLSRLVNDDDPEVRLQALDSLVGDGAREVVRQALTSKFRDVRLRAAQARARQGDPAACQPLLELALLSEPNPQDDAETGAATDPLVWRENVVAALDGLAELGDPATCEPLLPLTESDHAEIRRAAAEALVWTARDTTAELLAGLLRHSDPAVQFRAALGLVFCGREEMLTLVFGEDAGKVLAPLQQFQAALALGSRGESRLLGFLDCPDPQLRQLAMWVLVFRELREPGETPQRLLVALASQFPRLRLAAAEVLQECHEVDTFRAAALRQLNRRPAGDSWELTAETLDQLATLLVSAPPHVRCRGAALLGSADPLGEAAAKRRDGDQQHPQVAWEQQFRVFLGRFAAELPEAGQAAQAAAAANWTSQREPLCQLALGAYLGLLREQSRDQEQLLAVRRTAVVRLRELAVQQPELVDLISPPLIRALSDNLRVVRQEAFESLVQLGMDPEELASEAIESGDPELGRQGLSLLTAGASSTAANKLLTELMVSRNDFIAVSAAEALRQRVAVDKFGGQALEAVYPTVRINVLYWLAELLPRAEASSSSPATTATTATTAAAAADVDPKQAERARKILHQALQSRHRDVREEAALRLAHGGDPQAFAALSEMLRDAPRRRQPKLIAALQAFGDPRAAGVFLDRIAHDPQQTAVPQLFPAAASFRDPSVVERLLEMMEHDAWRQPAALAVYQISGYDQPVLDPEDERPDRSWEEKQSPRLDDVLTALCQRALQLGDLRFLSQRLSDLRWARSARVEGVLETLSGHPDEALRRGAVDALSWRLRKREGAAGPLLRALEASPPAVQFQAAEGLALAGRGEGINVLLAAVEMADDLTVRQRAVRALGELGDERALDLLLRLAGEDGHALQESAAEAIGHLGGGDKAARILSLLTRFLESGGGLAQRAVRGLRWLGTRESWQLVRQEVRKRSPWTCDTALEMLGYDDDSATRELLLELLRHEPHTIAFTSARRLFGEASLEPDYAVLRAPQVLDELPDCDELLTRVGKQGEAAAVFEILAECDQPVATSLAAALRSRDPLPAEAASQALPSPHPRVVEEAAHLLGLSDMPAKQLGKSLDAALQRWLEEWERQRELGDCDAIRDSLATVARLVWAAGRKGGDRKRLADLVRQDASDERFLPVRRAALAALAEGKLDEAALDTLVAAAADPEASLRQLAAAGLAGQSGARVAGVAETLLGDRAAFDRLAAGVSSADLAAAVRQGTRSGHYQGVVLPHAIRSGDADQLAAAAQDSELPEVTRLGAIEALAKMSGKAAHTQLEKLGANESLDEALRKAAWRGLRRARRAEAVGAQGRK